MSSVEPGEPDLHGRPGPAHRLAQLGHRQPGDVAQRQQGAVLRVQPGEGAHQRVVGRGSARVRPEDRSGDRRARAWSPRAHPGVSPGPSPRRQRASTATSRGPPGVRLRRRPVQASNQAASVAPAAAAESPTMTKATRVMSSLWSRTRRAKAAMSPSAAAEPAPRGNPGPRQGASLSCRRVRPGRSRGLPGQLRHVMGAAGPAVAPAGGSSRSARSRPWPGRPRRRRCAGSPR